jgi:hypothetical protein
LNPFLEKRLRELRSRILVRSWGYRQRAHAHGVWFRLRRVLADARSAHEIPRDEARRLVEEGYRVSAVGAELEPPKLIVFAPAKRVARIPSARSLPVQMSGELLAAECLALTTFAPASERGGPAG